MSRRNKGNRMQPIVKEAEFTPVDEKQEAIAQHQGETVNLDDVAFMVMIGRYKNGEPFFTNVNVQDFFTVSGLVNYAQSEIEAVLNEHRQAKKSEG